MIRGVILTLVLCLLSAVFSANASARYNPDALPICAQIISELTEGRLTLKEAEDISRIIAEAANKHFGSVTAGDMWLYMAIAYIESGFKVNVINYQNCRGMFQIHAPSWASKFGVKYGELLNPRTNAEIGILVFKYYLDLYKHIIPTLSAYNSDHPRAAIGYAHAVLNIRKKIMKRYVELYQRLHQSRRVMVID